MIPVDDLAIIRGIGVFDLLRTYDGERVLARARASIGEDGRVQCREPQR